MSETYQRFDFNTVETFLGTLIHNPHRVPGNQYEATYRHDDLINFRVGVLPESIAELAEGMLGAIMTRMYAVVGEAAESVGNVVDGKGESSSGLSTT